MATEVSSYDRDSQPYSCIGLIWVTFPDGTSSRGTCTLVGRNDILTATHVVYSPDNGGWAVDYDFYFGADYNDITGNFEDYGYSYFPTNGTTTTYAWPDQAFTDSNTETMIQSETQYDIALIGLSTPIGDTLGWLGLDAGYNGSNSAKAVGYPVGATGMMEETVSVQKSSYYNLYESNYNVMGAGSSGGPLLIGNYVIGVKSTGCWWEDIGFLYSYLTDYMDENNSLLSSVADTTAPTVASFSPTDGATGVAVGSNVVVTFSEAIQRGTGNIILKTASGTTVATYSAASSSNLSISGNTLTINPTAYFASTTDYKVEFAAGSITDLAGNSYAGTTSYNFTTIVAGNDTLVGGSSDLDGGAGIDTVTYSAALAAHTVIKTSSGYAVSGFELTNIERLHFSDVNLALDLDGNAGLTAKILGAVFGAPSVTIKEYVGIGLSLLDSGMSYPDLMLLALNARLGNGFSNAEEVNLLYQNLVGVLPSTADLNYYVGTITSGQFTQTSLAVMAADLDLNATNIDLVGLGQTGIEYSL